ncbi:MAG: hypothetical protein OXI70_11900, partial [Chloroflexota bacterium]|nr:hypothetical protein [Chloroflexota bacterium]
MKVTRGSASETVAIAGFTAGGLFTVTIPGNGFFTADDVSSTDIMEDDKFELVGSNLLTIDSKSPALKSPEATTGIVYSTSMKKAVRGLMARANSIQVNFTDDGKNDDDAAGSGLQASS